MIHQMRVHPTLECNNRIYRNAGRDALYDLNSDTAVRSCSREWAGQPIEDVLCYNGSDTSESHLEDKNPDDLWIM